MGTDDFTAEDIFNAFQSRRDVLARTGKLAAASALPALLAACAVEPNPTVTGPDGETLIRVTDGLNCFDGGCVRLDLARREVSVIGREAAEVPEDIEIETGTVTPEEFSRLRRLARTAPREETGGGDGGAGGGGGGGNDGGFE
jgi:hypothetical protein